MKNTVIATLIMIPLMLAILGGIIYLFILICKALKKYIGSTQARQQKSEVKKQLGEVLKEYRTQSKMTQEFVAESLGVSRQAVSKWESGKSDPSTSNLIALSNLYKISMEEILKQVRIEH